MRYWFRKNRKFVFLLSILILINIFMSFAIQSQLLTTSTFDPSQSNFSIEGNYIGGTASETGIFAIKYVRNNTNFVGVYSSNGEKLENFTQSEFTSSGEFIGSYNPVLILPNNNQIIYRTSGYNVNEQVNGSRVVSIDFAISQMNGSSFSTYYAEKILPGTQDAESIFFSGLYTEGKFKDNQLYFPFYYTVLNQNREVTLINWGIWEFDFSSNQTQIYVQFSSKSFGYQFEIFNQDNDFKFVRVIKNEDQFNITQYKFDIVRKDFNTNYLGEYSCTTSICWFTKLNDDIISLTSDNDISDISISNNQQQINLESEYSSLSNIQKIGSDLGVFWGKESLGETSSHYYIITNFSDLQVTKIESNPLGLTNFHYEFLSISSQNHIAIISGQDPQNDIQKFTVVINNYELNQFIHRFNNNGFLILGIFDVLSLGIIFYYYSNRNGNDQIDNLYPEDT